MSRINSKENMYQRIGTIIRSRRVRKNITQESLAEAIDRSRNFISMLENGRKPASIDTYFRISSVLGIRLHELFVDKDADTEIYDLVTLLNDCSRIEVYAIMEILRTVKTQITMLRR